MGFSSINVASPHICLLTGPPRLNLRGNGFDKSFKVRVWLWMVTAVASERCQACSVSLGGCQRGIQLTTQTHAHRNVQTARYPPASVTMETDRPPIEKNPLMQVCVFNRARVRWWILLWGRDDVDLHFRDCHFAGMSKGTYKYMQKYIF